MVVFSGMSKRARSTILRDAKKRGRPAQGGTLALVVRDGPSAPTRRRQIADGIRSLVRTGALAPGAPLPATRQLAGQLGVSRTTVDAAYAQLRAEGYIEARERAATVVATALPERFLTVTPAAGVAPATAADPPARAPRPSDRSATAWSDDPTASRDVDAPVRPFMTGTPLVDAKLRDELARRTAAMWRRAPRALLHYGDPVGYAPLRAAIARHVASARGVRATADQVIITHGAQQALGLAAMLALDPGDQAWIEDPGYQGARAALRSAGARLVPVRVDDQGLDVAAAERRAPAARLAYITPSHQYPTGATMSAPRRFALLAWARRAGAWLLEDDYESEYRYATAPLPALQGLDPDGRVLYAGTFSKTLAPALRLGYLIVPPALVAAARRARAVGDRNAPTVEQATIAGMIDDGSYARHIRRMRLLYAERQAALRTALETHCARWLEVAPSDAGMHLVGWLPIGVDDVAVANAARAAGLEVTPVSRLALRPLARGGLMLGHAAFAPPSLRTAAHRLGAVLALSARVRR